MDPAAVHASPASRPTAPAAGAVSRLTPAGRFRPEDLPELRDWVQEVAPTGGLDHPARVFGPWSGLPSPARQALREAVERHLRTTVDTLPGGPLWTGTVRRLRELDRHLHDAGRLSRARGHLVRWTERVRGAPLNLRRRLERRARLRRWTTRPDPGPVDLLAALGRGPEWLLGDFVEGVRVDPRARGFYEDPTDGVTWGYFLGLDLLQTREGICCVECNLRPGIVARPRTVMDEGGLTRRLLEAAGAHGARRLLWIEAQGPPVPGSVIECLREQGAAAGIEVDFRDDPCMPSRRADPLPPGFAPPPRWYRGTVPPSGTLVIRRDEIPAGPDYLLSHKEPSIRALHAAFVSTGETRVHTLPMTRHPPPLDDVPDPGVPDLVYKYPDSFAGKGVYFLKVENREEAVRLARDIDRRTGEPPGLFQPFRRSCLPGTRRSFDVRAEILLTPAGTWNLREIQRVAERSLPERIEPGVQPCDGTFTSNLSTGGRISSLTVDPAPFRTAARAVGEALGRILERTFEVRPPGCPSRGPEP